ncbi:Regulator of condensation [Paragonimus heterotremus]|uniref:Regulator of condensation n=1 Tax=Paragonimus heterotremus TaxID=100268 RepID=A0A8J4WCR0_9TREM|nr:Regulator of condensation [Paragonimus heterotremus]
MALIAGTFRGRNGKFVKLDSFAHRDLLLFSDWSSSIVKHGKECVVFCGNEATTMGSLISSACSTDYDLYFLTSNGELFIMDKSTAQMQRLTTSKFIALGCCESALYCVSSDHNLLIEESGINPRPPIFKTLPLKVKSVACGSEFLLCLTPVGQVFSKGLGSRGQLGLGDLTDRDEFTRIEALEVLTVTSVAAGTWHSACVTDSGDLYTWGWNEHGQLGHRSFTLCKKSTGPCPLDPTDAISVLSIPKPVDTSDEDVTEVACGSRHTAYLTNKGNVYVFGWNGFGQLGFDPQIVKALDSPTPIKLPTSAVGSSYSVRGICCGLWTTIVRLDE